MSASRETPTELGIPLPLVPIEDIATTQKDLNWHHHFHPRYDPLLTTEGGRAIRVARLQLAYTNGNHREYHNYFDGPPLPKNPEEQARIAMLTRAGFVPEHGILMRGRDRKPLIVRLNTRQRLLLQSEVQLKQGSTDTTRGFLGNFVLAQDLSDIKPSRIDQFLHTTDPQHKLFLGRMLLSEAIQRATLPVAGDYRRAWAAGQIPYSQSARPHKFLRNALGRTAQRTKLVRQLEQKLAA